MARPKKESVDPTNTVAKDRVFTTTAMDIVLDVEKRAFFMVTVGYDIKTKEAVVLKKEQIADNKALALHKAKEVIVKKMFGIE